MGGAVVAAPGRPGSLTGARPEIPVPAHDGLVPGLAAGGEVTVEAPTSNVDGREGLVGGVLGADPGARGAHGSNAFVVLDGGGV